MAPVRLSTHLPRRGRGRPKGSVDQCPRKRRTKTTKEFHITGEPGPARPIPSFPLQEAPKCLACGQACKPAATLEGNINGGAGRPYYYCDNPKHPRKASHFHGMFHCYNDDVGILKDSPLCFCKMPTRYTRAGYTSKEKTDTFACCIRACSWVHYIKHAKKKSYYRLKMLGEDMDANWDSNTVRIHISGASEGERRWIAFSDKNHAPNTRIEGTLNPPLPLVGNKIGTRMLLDGTQETFAYSPSTSPEPEQQAGLAEAFVPAPIREIIQIDSSDDEAVEEPPQNGDLAFWMRGPTDDLRFGSPRHAVNHQVSLTMKPRPACHGTASGVPARKTTSAAKPISAQRRRSAGGAEPTRNIITPVCKTGQRKQRSGHGRHSSGDSSSPEPRANYMIPRRAQDSSAAVSPSSTSSNQFLTSFQPQPSPSFDALSSRQGCAGDDSVPDSLFDDDRESHGTIESSDSEDEDAVNALIQRKAVMLARRQAEIEAAHASRKVRLEPGVKREKNYY